MPTSVEEASFADLTAEVERRRVAKAKEVVEIMLAYRLDVEALIKHGGLPASAFRSTTPEPRATQRAEAPYYARHPGDAQAWRGRGRRPLWLIKEMDQNGRALEEFLISPEGRADSGEATESVATQEGVSMEPSPVLMIPSDVFALSHALQNDTISIGRGPDTLA